ncbi:MAG: hypothetical protein LH471_08705, partial [Salinibacterium sp.]|nr:hypothetical protein [Salinibacterium sp.]
AAGTRALPDGNSLYAITCPYYSDDAGQTPNNQVLAVDEQTAVAVAVGSGSEIDGSNCAGSPAVDPIDGAVYALVAVDDDNFPILVTVDLVTGISTKVADITDGEDPLLPQAMAIGLDGAAYALYNADLYSLNLGDGVMTLIGETVGDAWGFVSDPITGLFYALDSDGQLFEIDVSDGSFVLLDQLSFLTTDEGTYSLTMDANGVFWIGLDVESGDEYRVELWSVTLADPATSDEFVGELALGSIAPYSEALVIGPAYVAAAPAPALAATGIDLVVPIVAGIVLLAVGVGLAVVARRQTRKN